MGLFGQRQSDPVEWAGLPSEPAEPESPAERLADAAPVDVGALGIGDLPFGQDGTVESIVIPVAPAIEGTEADDPEADG